MFHRSFPRSWLITGFATRLTRWVPLVEKELHTLPEHMSSSFSILRGSCYSIFSFIFMFCRSLFCSLVLFLSAILLSVLLRLADSDYPFGIFKLFLDHEKKTNNAMLKQNMKYSVRRSLWIHMYQSENICHSCARVSIMYACKSYVF